MCISSRVHLSFATGQGCGDVDRLQPDHPPYDWFTNPDIKAKFKAKYGYELGVPVNWSAYVRANSNSTHENMKQKKAATPIPLAMSGIKMRTKKRGNE